MAENKKDVKITRQDFMSALSKVFPSVSKRDEIAYAKLQTSLRRTRGHIEETK